MVELIYDPEDNSYGVFYDGTLKLSTMLLDEALEEFNKYCDISARFEH